MANHGSRRFVVGAFAVATLGLALAHADRLPGRIGDVIRANIAADRDATALFYTEVRGWHLWTADDDGETSAPASAAALLPAEF